MAIPSKRRHAPAASTCAHESYPSPRRSAIHDRDWPRFIVFDGETIDTHRSITSLGWHLTSPTKEGGPADV